MVHRKVRESTTGALAGAIVSRAARDIVFLCALIAALCGRATAQPAFTGTAQATVVNDLGGDGQPSIGDTVEVTLEITNSGPSDAPGATLTLNIDPNATLVPESINVSPIVRGDSYAAVGNLVRTASTAVGVLANDFDADSDELFVTAYDATSLLGGTVQMSVTGAFSYTPPVGLTGATDEFRYTVTDSRGLSSSGKVTIPLSGRVWFVDSRVASSGDGSSGAPFKSLAPFLGGARPDSPGDYILLRSGGAPYAGGLVLLDQETVVGDRSGLTVGGLTVVPPSGVQPVVQVTSGAAIVLGNSSAIRELSLVSSGTEAVRGNGVSGSIALSGVTIAGSGGAGGIRLSSSTAAFTISDLQLSLTGTGTGVSADGLSGGVTLSSSAISVGAGRSFEIINQSGGSFSMTGSTAVSTAAAGTVRIANITGGAVALSGITASSSAGVPALSLEGMSSSVQITGSTFTGSGLSPLAVSALQGTVTLDQTTISSDRTIELSGLTGGTFSFGDLSVAPASGAALRLAAATGIVQLDSLAADMSTSGSTALLVQGHSGSLEISAGMITGFTAAPAVSLLGSENITLKDFTIDGDFASTANGIEADSVDGLILSDVVIREIGDNNGGTSTSGTETALLLSHLSGTISLDGTTIEDVGRDAISVDNNVSNDTTGETLSLSLDGVTIRDVGEFTLLLDTFQNDATDISIVGSLIEDVGKPGLRAITLQYGGNGANSLTVQSSIIRNTGNGNIFVRAQDSAAVEVIVDQNNLFDGTVSESIFLRSMGQSGAPSQSRSSIRARIQDTQFGAGIGLEGVYADVEDDGGNLEIALIGNTDLGTGAGLSTVQASTAGGRVCGRLLLNSSPLNPGLNVLNGGTFLLEGFGGGNAAAAESYLETTNPSLDVFAAGSFGGGGPCLTP